LDAAQLAERAAEHGILIERGDVHFLSDSPPKNYFRLGFSSIPTDRITPGVRELAQLVGELTSPV
ncbi:MAG: PLP-dependent aminotransferase family protein, partial [Gammaproteobacteria bacterium]|nr:PLP-dependent aminotransferase family protein [Gammaproteobacteria bacterium]